MTKNIKLINVTENPVDIIWKKAGKKPEPPMNPVTIHDLKYAGIFIFNYSITVYLAIDRITVYLYMNYIQYTIFLIN